MEDNNIFEKEYWRAIGLRGIDYKLFEEYEGVGGLVRNRRVSIFRSI